MDLFGGELLAIDGSKFRAVQARDRSFTPARLTKLIKNIDAMIAVYLRQLEAHDHREAAVTAGTAAELQERIARLATETKQIDEDVARDEHDIRESRARLDSAAAQQNSLKVREPGLERERDSLRTRLAVARLETEVVVTIADGKVVYRRDPPETTTAQ